MISYLLKSACCLAFLLIFYHLFLEREKMHQFNRFYLLGSVLFSFIAPLIIIYIQVPAEIIEVPITYNEPVVLNSDFIIEEETPINYWNLALGFSAVISALLSIRFIVNLLKIARKISANTQLKIDNAVLVLVEDAISPHTFWNYIFINKDEYKSHKIEDELFTHELTHVTQKHTFDVLLIEVLKIVFWFNPLFYFLKKSIQLNHEFIADEKVINSFKNISEYQYLLLNKAAWNNDYYLASNLNYSLTKKRLVMMTTKTSKVNNWLKKLAVIPLLMGSIYVFAERVETYENTSDDSLEKLTEENLFIASVESNEDNVTLRCHNCERWGKLNIPLNEEHIITDWGFTNSERVADGVYAFSVKATQNSIEFKGLKNTTWKNLSVDLTKKRTQFLNEKGILDYEKSSLNETLNSSTPAILTSAKNNGNNKSTPEYHYLKQTFWVKDKTGKKVSKKYPELSTYYKKKWLLFPPHPKEQKVVSNEKLNQLKDASVYVVRINGNLVKNSSLNNYKAADFVTFSSRKISKLAKLPQQFHYNLLTGEGFETGNIIKELAKKHQKRKTSKQSIPLEETKKPLAIKDTLPKVKKIVVNHKEKRFTYVTKDGKKISKKFSEMTEEEKKMLPPPPAPVYVSKKALSSKKFEALKNSKKYAVWIDGKIAENSVLNNYKATDFYSHHGSFVYKNARSKRFPQEYQFQLYTLAYVKKKKLLPPPPPKARKNPKAPRPVKIEVKEVPEKPKTGFINAKGQNLYYVQNKKGITYYNRWGQTVTKEGKVINPKQTDSNKVIPNQNISKVYKNGKVVSEFKKVNVPPAPPKKYRASTIPPPPPMSAEELVFRYPKARFYVNNKKVSHKVALAFVKNNEDISVITQEKQGKKIIKFTQLKSQVSIDKINDLSNSEIIGLPKGPTEDISYYLDDQPIAKADLDKISPQKIATITVKKEKDNSKSIYATSKK